MTRMDLSPRRLTQATLWVCTVLVAAAVLPEWLTWHASAPPGTWPGPRGQVMLGVALAMGVISWLYGRGWALAADLAPLVMSVSIPFAFDARVQTLAVLPQGLWIPFVLALTVSRLRVVVLTLVVSFALALWTFPGAFSRPITIVGSLIMLSVLMAGRLTQRALVQKAQEAARREHDSAEALRQSEATLQAMFAGMGDAMVLVDAQRRIQRVNPAFVELFGHSAEDVLGRTTEFLYADPADYPQR